VLKAYPSPTCTEASSRESSSGTSTSPSGSKKCEDPFEYEVDLSSRIEADLEVPVDIHVLNEAPITFRYAVFKEGRPLFSKDERARIEVVDETVRQYADLRMLRSLCKAGERFKRPITI